MQNLINIEQKAIGATRVQTVDARELHAFLEVGKHFASWISDRIDQFGFVEDQDYAIVVCDSGKSGRGGNRRSRDYCLTINSAIQIAAAEKSTRPLIVQKFIESIQDVSALWDAIRNIELPDDLPEPMYVYAIKNPDTGNIKIGVSKDPEGRLKQLQVGNDAVLVLMQQVSAPHRFQDEKLLHNKNSQLQVRGEWFRPSATINYQPLLSAR